MSSAFGGGIYVSELMEGDLAALVVEFGGCGEKVTVGAAPAHEDSVGVFVEHHRLHGGDAVGYARHFLATGLHHVRMVGTVGGDDGSLLFLPQDRPRGALRRECRNSPRIVPGSSRRGRRAPSLPETASAGGDGA